MRQWTPHVTVATVVEDGGRYLMVEERDRDSGKVVLNQPAGHLEANESLAEAALRETLEETGYRVTLRGVLGIALWTAPANGVTYYRTSFLAAPLPGPPLTDLDPDILRTYWLDYNEILAESDRMRSPLVLATIEQHRRGICHPLDMIYFE